MTSSAVIVLAFFCKQFFFLILAIFCLSSAISFAQDYKRPTANAPSTDGNAGSICWNNPNDQDMPGGYVVASSMSPVYVGKSGAGPISSPYSSISTGHVFGNPTANQIIFSGWQPASGTYSALTLNVNLACTSEPDGKYGDCGMAYTLDGGSTWTYAYDEQEIDIQFSYTRKHAA